MSNPNVLIIDDEADLRNLLSITLSRMQLNPIAVESIGAAKQTLSQQQFSLCLTDMNLPDGTGIELVQHVQRHYSEMPIAVITAYGNMKTATLAMKEGAYDFIAKPISLPRLRQLVYDGLAKRDELQAAPITELLNTSKLTTLTCHEFTLLTEHFLAELATLHQAPQKSLADDAITFLKDYPFEGGAEELKQLLEQAFLNAETERLISTSHLAAYRITPKEMPQRQPNQPLEKYLQEVERHELLTVLESTFWNRTAAAKQLGMTFRSLRYRLKKLGIDQEEK